MTSSLSFSFSIDKPSQSGITFLLTPLISQQEGYKIPPRSIPSAIHRILHQIEHYLLVAVIPSEENDIKITFFNVPQQNAKLLCEKALSQLNSNITFSLKEVKFVYDQYLVKIAYEAFIIRTLEEAGNYLMYFESTILYDPRGILVSDLSINSQSPLQFVSQMIKNQNHKMLIEMTGQISCQKINIFDSLSKTQKKECELKSSVDLDFRRCLVLPRFSRAYVIKIAKPNPVEIESMKKYWWQSHGFLMNEIQYVAKVTFSKDETAFALTYPLQCVVDINQPLVRNDAAGRKVAEFIDSMKDDITRALIATSTEQKLQKKLL
ncbi:hypothetical protein TRFO_02101 [Tritrichomonas foetus]|uniref:Uncharacterized protein n=1 Tax=Tritrichomonas foetus TaxID=1144522 RepID=A0A1J4JE78_9EUKA|nr:hypothetical protein TRFO_02101 [Tritrichomonas foetus]|eukprot:OHS96953.1 hypothetical protein TRFO_02101 [Tritrichomonas foetus]